MNFGKNIELSYNPTTTPKNPIIMNTLTKSALALTMASAMTITAKAAPIQADFSNQDSIVMLGFHAAAGTGNAKNLLVALGSVSELLGVNGSGASYSATFDLSSALSSTFGSDWSRSSVLWGAFGSDNTTFQSVIASAFDTALTDEQAGVTVDNAYAFNGIQGNLAVSALQGTGLATGIANATSGANSIYSGYGYASMDASSGGSWTSFNSGNPNGAFNLFSGAQAWTTGTNLRFAIYDPSAPDLGLPVASLDDLQLSIDTGTGVVSISAIPEPSTYALMGLGLLGLVIVARRRSVS